MNEKELNETDYLSATRAMKTRLEKAAAQEKNIERVKISLAYASFFLKNLI